MSIAVREVRMGDLLMLEEMLNAIAMDLLGRRAGDAMAPIASGGKAFLADSGSFAYAAYLDNDPVGGLWGTRVASARRLVECGGVRVTSLAESSGGVIDASARLTRWTLS